MSDGFKYEDVYKRRQNMLRRLLEFFISIAFGAFMYVLFHDFYVKNHERIGEYIPEYVPFVTSVILGIVFFFVFSQFLSLAVEEAMDRAESRLARMGIKELIACVFGIFIGLAIANLIGIAISGYGLIGTSITICLNIVFGYLGFRVARRKNDEISSIGGTLESAKHKDKNAPMGRAKILDTSTIIDGRILDLLKTGFIEGKIIIPNFVLEELRHIADSSDSLKRNRGRRGLDILNEIQKQTTVNVEIVDFSTKEKMEVDTKLLKMAEKIDAFVVTNDYNLNKVAEFQGVKVLNVNELSNAIKPVVLPGEDMQVTLIKAGKEHGQGIAYLNDGTMIVVEGGNKAIGETMNVVVTSVLQTAAGRMIFAKRNAS